MERISNSEPVEREVILAKAKELAELIAASGEVQFYKKAEKQISGNERVQSLIRSIKSKQKEAVAFEVALKKPEMVEKIEAELANLQDELDQIPIVAEFRHSQAEINETLQFVVNVIRGTVSEKIDVIE